MKKLLLTLLLLCGVVPAWAYQPWVYLLNGGELRIVNWKVTGTHANIDLSVNGYPVARGAALAIHPNGNVAYVLDGVSNGVNEFVPSVQVVCLLTNKVLATISIDTSDGEVEYVGTHQIAITPDGKYVYVAEAIVDRASATDSAARIVVISTATNKVVASLSLKGPGGTSLYGGSLFISPDGKFVYVDANGYVLVMATATNQLVATIATGTGNPHPFLGNNDDFDQMAMTPDGSLLYVSGSDAGHVSVVSTAQRKVVDTIPLNFPTGLAVTIGGKYVWVLTAARTASAQIAVIETSTNNVVDSFADPGLNSEFAFSPDGQLVYSPNGNGIAIVSTSTKKEIRQFNMSLDGPVVFGPY